jgi:hypothetical protein
MMQSTAIIGGAPCVFISIDRRILIEKTRGSCGSKIGIASLHVYILAASTLNGLKGLPWFLLETIMVQNSSIYDELEKYMNDNSSPQTHVYDDVYKY